MSNSAPSFIGASNAGSDKRELFLKVFSGEVISQFEETTVTLDKHTVRTINGGMKSAQFPVLGRMPDAEYHTPGSEILGQEVKQAERVINVDALLISHVFIDNLDEVMSHFEVRSKYSKLMGNKLGLQFDNHVMRNIILAATESETVTGTGADGRVITDAGFASATGATKFKAWNDALFAAAAEFDGKFVSGPRYCLMSPADYYFLVQWVQDNGFSAIHGDYKGQGSYAEGNIVKIAGITLIPHPLIPTADYTGDTYHKVDCTGTSAIVFTPDAVGTVKVLDISIQSEWDIRRQGTLMVARYAMGHGVLQPECAIQFKSA